MVGIVDTRMAQEINLGGTIYISSKRAAEIMEYSQDYIGQLARAGQIEARRVAGMWYVLEDSVRKHKEKRDIIEIEEQAEKPLESPLQVVEPDESAPVVQENALESEITFDGKGYVSATRASSITGYSHDYVTQLAREEKIPSHQIGNRWYVERQGILAHKKEKDSLLAAVQAQSVGINRESIESSPQSLPETRSESHFVYQEDASELFPRIQEKEVSLPEAVMSEAYEEDGNDNVLSDAVNQIRVRVIPEKRKQYGEPAATLRTSISAYLSAPKVVMFSIVFVGFVASGVGAFVYLQRTSKNILPVPGMMTNTSVTMPAAAASAHLTAIAEQLFSKELEYQRRR